METARPGPIHGEGAGMGIALYDTREGRRAGTLRTGAKAAPAGARKGAGVLSTGLGAHNTCTVLKMGVLATTGERCGRCWSVPSSQCRKLP